MPKNFKNTGSNTRKVDLIILKVIKHKKGKVLHGVKLIQEIGKNKVTPCSKCGKQHGGIMCYKEISAYFNCGECGHFVRDCPQTKNSQALKPYGGKPKPRTQGRVFSMTNKDTQASLEVVIGITQLHSQPIRVLIDPVVTHSFISASLVDLLGSSSSLLEFDMLVSTPIGKSFLATRVVKDDNFVIGDRDLHLDLILLKLHDFDIILGMDWLATHHVLVDCFAKKVTFHIPEQPEFSIKGSSGDTPIQLISVMKAHSLLKKGCEGYLAYIVGDEKNEKLEDIPIVRDFPYVFPEELPGLIPKREVEFTI